MAKNQSSSINLYKGKDKSIVEKFIDWALTLGRVVVILTEAIALLAFLYRFSLDRQLIDLHEQIKRKERIVNQLQKEEEKFRNLQDRITIAGALNEKSASFGKTFSDIMQLSPRDTSITSIHFSTNNVRFEARFQSLSGLTQFINELKKYPGIKTVSLDRIENKTSSAIIGIGVSATFKQEIK